MTNTVLDQAGTYECLSLEVHASVAHIRLNRPDTLNTLTREFWKEFRAVIAELSRAGTIRAAVLSSTGKHFSAGMDLTVFQGDVLPGTSQPVEREQLRRLVLALQDVFTQLETARMPVVAAIQGGCIGGAFDMVCACDIRYATDTAFFCIQETNLAMMADLGTLQRLPRLLPEGLVRELAYTGDRLSAERAKSLGFVNEVFETHEQMLAHALGVASRIAKQSPLAVTGTKESLNFSRDHGTHEGLAMAALWQSAMFDPDQVASAAKAQATKQDAVYPDLLPVKTEL